jgi:hypothetical protein
VLNLSLPISRKLKALSTSWPLLASPLTIVNSSPTSLLAWVSIMTPLLPLSLQGKTRSLSLISMATCCPMSSVLRPTNQHLKSTSLLPTWLNGRAHPIHETIVASTRAIATSTSLGAGGVAVVVDHLSNIFLVLASSNV